VDDPPFARSPPGRTDHADRWQLVRHDAPRVRPSLDAWRIFWIDPATNFFCQQIGKAVGPDIVQEGTMESGSRSRWRFTKITARSFHWLGEESPDDGATWRLLVEVLARRV
jgi:hypothetical protein